jgi:16S rRNA (uracil1498-N3)-methyltransferase
MHLFFAPEFSDDLPFLPEEEAKHALKVLRLDAGATVSVTDGLGNRYEATIAATDIKKCRLTIRRHEPEYGKKSFTIHVAVAPTKNADRTEWLVEKCVEIGVDEISFINCERSERKYFKLDRVEKIAVAAMKQSLKAYLPRLNDLIPLREFLKKRLPGNNYIAHLVEGERKLLQHIVPPNGTYCVLIGPEGDFTPDEVNVAVAAGFVPASLGSSRLRTETAGMVACHILNLVNS